MKYFFLFIIFLVMSSCQEPNANSVEEFSTEVKNAQAFELTAKSDEQLQLKYLQFLPENYDSRDDWPLLLFLHGMGERGNDLSMLTVYGPSKMAMEGELQEFVVVVPQCPDNDYWDTHQQQSNLIGLVHFLKENLQIDNNRVYVTGLSMGGFGAWHLATAIPHEVAAVAPVCGGGNPWLAEYLKDVPIWAFHGAKDNVVPLSASEEMVNASKENGATAKLTIYPEANHNSWDQAYATKELYDWFLEQNLANRQ